MRPGLSGSVKPLRSPSGLIGREGWHRSNDSRTVRVRGAVVYRILHECFMAHECGAWVMEVLLPSFIAGMLLYGLIRVLFSVIR